MVTDEKLMVNLLALMTDVFPAGKRLLFRITFPTESSGKQEDIRMIAHRRRRERIPRIPWRGIQPSDCQVS